MKSITYSFFCFFIVLSSVFSSDLFAEDWYVVPSAEVPIRRGQGTEYKIIAVVQDGTKVSFVEERDDWAKVRLESGKEGWILKRFLSNSVPLQNQVENLQQNNRKLKDKLGETESRLKELLQAHNQTEEQLTTCMAERDRFKGDFQTLKEDSENIVQTKEKLIATENELSAMDNQLADLQFENTALKKNSALIWFLAGSCVLLIGWLVGFVTGKKNKKRRGSLL